MSGRPPLELEPEPELESLESELDEDESDSEEPDELDPPPRKLLRSGRPPLLLPLLPLLPPRKLGRLLGRSEAKPPRPPLLDELDPPRPGS